MIQIQPVFQNRKAYIELAEKEGLTFESLEISMPFLQQDLREQAIHAMNDSPLFTGLHGHFIDVNPASGDPDYRALSRKKCEDSCKIAKRAQIQRVVFHSSCFPFLRDGYLTNWAEVSAGFFTDLSEKYDLDLFIENSMDLDPTPLRALMDACSSERVKACLDIGHAHYSRVPVKKWFDVLGDDIAYLHLSDNMGDFDEHLPLGRGNINWQEASELTGELKRKDLPITLEVGNIDGIRQSVQYLKDNRLFGLGG